MGPSHRISSVTDTLPGPAHTPDPLNMDSTPPTTQGGQMQDLAEIIIKKAYNPKTVSDELMVMAKSETNVDKKLMLFNLSHGVKRDNMTYEVVYSFKDLDFAGRDFSKKTTQIHVCPVKIGVRIDDWLDKDKEISIKWVAQCIDYLPCLFRNFKEGKAVQVLSLKPVAAKKMKSKKIS